MMFGWPLVILSIVAFILVIVTLVAFLPQFYIEKVTIHGLRMIRAEDIQTLITKNVGEHFISGIGKKPVQYLTLRYGEIERQILENFVLARSAKVQFRFPSEVRVSIVEKTEILAVRVSGGFALLDSSLSVISVANEHDFNLPIVEGIRVQSSPEINKEIDVEDKTKLYSAIHLTAALIEHDTNVDSHEKTELMKSVKQIKQISDHTYFLFIPLSQGGEIRVRLEDNRSLQDKLKILSYLLDEGDLWNRGAGELDLTGQSVFFRPDAA